jgi:sulfite reductase alpha subunit-like flavoprotein
MDAFEVTELPAARRAVFVTSTMGQGDPPSNARSFWKFLLRKSLPEDSLRRLSFACFGLGDSHYAKFNVAAKKLHRRLERLGATSVVALGLGDDQHPAGYDYALDPWLTGLWKVLRSDDEFSDEPRRNDSRQQTSDSVSDACRFAVFQETAASRFDEAVDAPPSVETLLDVAEKFDALTEAAAPIDRRWLKRGSATNGNDDSSRGSSSFGVAASVRALTSDTAVARTAHVEIALDDKSDDKSAHSSYDVGDCLEVMPFALCGGAASEATGYGKSADAFGDAEIDTTWCVGADFVLRRSGIDPRAFVRVAAADSSRTNSFASAPDSAQKSFAVPARHLVLACLDIASASPRRHFYETAARFAASAAEKERLLYFASPEGRDDARKYGASERRTLLEFLDDFPSVAVPLPWLLQTAPRLKPRLFSIASSFVRDGPNTVHLTVTRAEWHTPYGRQRRGLCSTPMTTRPPTRPPTVSNIGADEKKPILADFDVTNEKESFVAQNFVGARLAARVVKGASAFPDDAQPAVCVCTGSGVAPVRAMVRQRDARFMSEAEAANQTNVHGSVAPTLVFFGCRHRSRDFLYADEWADLVRRGTLLGNDGAPACGEDSMANDVGDTSDSMFTPVFSRDGERKRYVSHALRDDSRRVWDVLRRERAAVVVCGSTGAMPEDVHEALVDVCVREGGMDDTQARAFLRRMDARGDYVVEAW